ncbi:MAG: hypothetical protein C4530_16650 [Desulfobacteraceae bacterium]|nr:MAG: hypothetical protein C4530_16650 [Desulfobacteraceae bacterium]
MSKQVFCKQQLSARPHRFPMMHFRCNLTAGKQPIWTKAPVQTVKFYLTPVFGAVMVEALD